jgi:ribosomal protein S24E
MSLKIITEKVNSLFGRKEVRVAIEASKVPTKEEAAKLIAEKYSTKSELVRVKEVQGKFGTTIVIIDSDIYDNEKTFESYVKKTKKELEADRKALDDKRKADAEAKKAKEEAKASKETKAEVAEESE